MKIHQIAASILALQQMSTWVSSHPDTTGKISIDFPSTVLSSPRSDMTATTVSSTHIIIVGGCDNEEGNVKGDGYYYCPSITNTVEKYIIATGTVTKLTSAPRARYRHAAVLIDDYIWLIGGRDVEDNIITAVDVFHVITETWETVGQLSNVTSDLAVYAKNEIIYMVGGWVADYSEASNQVTMFDTSDLLVNDSPDAAIEVLDSGLTLTSARGDTHVAVYNDGVYVSGGFNLECSALSSVEYLDTAASGSSFVEINGLLQGRGDKALVEMNGYLFAIGGEDIDGCGGSSIALDDVEVFHANHGTPLSTQWQDLGSIPRNTFRFPAAAAPSENKIYTFGGQNHYDEDCECYRTSDLITIYTWDPDGDTDISAAGHDSIGFGSSVVVTSVISAVVVMLM
mmetsp:Transcript_12681/g.19086  ORF Transcript_12681/g.19086 Transcript_12681/m.19086 type:complete len:398 (+) Transcript_12681:296-1489(+)|eukprot:CAMPEP_0196811078 /NCGR_PEP_ID=MMETSP1362-20130617/16936_1 /TAXON_ID=163516 /ORGANISM="Leptocylindrus danicus, Strain CCMP1856" /LENGTH=397 /DNA_ID=CAMNT_0042186323 /DNA_START=222 /DNA_END=1415 /DNA_ORIENTATION=+